jgi:hypothetical protein
MHASRTHPDMISSIDYEAALPAAEARDYANAAALLHDVLPPLWLNAYYQNCNHDPNVLQINVDGFEHLFDFTSDPSRGNADSPEDRLVAVYGLSKTPDAERDSSRIRGFLGGGLKGADHGSRDKGHFIAHSAGGGMDINLFPQRPELNRGRSEGGRVFRKMERFAATHPGTFVFARPVYTDDSWTPSELDYGVLLPEKRLWVERFAN